MPRAREEGGTLSDGSKWTLTKNYSRFEVMFSPHDKRQAVWARLEAKTWPKALKEAPAALAKLISATAAEAFARSEAYRARGHELLRMEKEARGVCDG